ncbi:MAG: MFS transporter [Xanthobacteraceae bacterium]|nr:MFS transporter [Xanthobacteraceae bacterium]
MPSHPQERAGGRFVQRMALFYASTFIALGVHLPFLPVWLAAKGLAPQAIGVVLALPMVLRLFVIPLATRAADRHDALRMVVMLATLVALFGFGTLGFMTSTAAIAAIYPLAATAFMLLFVLSDVYALRGLAPHRRAYGPVRLWGSAAFIVANLAAGYLLDFIAARDLIWLIVGAVALCLVTAWTLPPLGARPAGTPSETPPARLLLRDPSFIAVAAAASLIQGSHALYYGFSTIAWQADGYGGGTIGVLWALGVLAEIVLFALSVRLPAAFTPTVLILIGAAGALLRWSVMTFNPPGALLVMLQCLHGLSFGATHLGTLGFIARAAPAGLAATAQGYLAVANGVAIAAGTGLSGLLYGRFGTAAYGAMALIAAAGLAAGFVAHRLQKGESR